MRNRRQAALMAMQHVDRQSHPYTLVFLLHTLTGSCRLLQPFSPGNYARSRHPKREVTPPWRKDLGQSPRRCCPSARLTRVSTALGRATRSLVYSLPIIIAVQMGSGKWYCEVSLPLQAGIIALACRSGSYNSRRFQIYVDKFTTTRKQGTIAGHRRRHLSFLDESSPQHTDQHVVNRDNTGFPQLGR